MTDRNTTGWKLAGTNTFRLASAKLLGEWGTNLQNTSEQLCKIYIPDEGKIFLQADQAGAEALVVAYIAPQGHLRELFNVGIKSHIYVALHLFKEHWDQVLGKPSGFVDILSQLPIPVLAQQPEAQELFKLIKKDSEKYFMGKKTCHASNYGMRKNTFRMDILKESNGRIALSSRQAELFLSTYHAIFPEISMWHKALEKELNETHILRNLFGYPRYFHFAYINEDIRKKAYAFVPQSTVGIITNIAFVEMQMYIENLKLDWDLLNNKHDSILLQCPEDEVKDAAKILRRFLEKDLTAPNGEKFTMKSEVKIGHNWGEDNPEGMKEI